MNAQSKGYLAAGFAVLTAWILYLYLGYSEFQNLRHDSLFYILDLANPVLYAIIIFLCVLIAMCIYSNEESKTVHIFLIIIFALIVLCTPYFVAGTARFPDTYGVAWSVENLETSMSGLEDYPTNYPISYLLFHMVHNIGGLDLYQFSILIFSPLVIAAHLVIWYQIACRLFNPRTALLATFLTTPVLLIEITITPNATAIVVLLSAFLLVLLGSVRGQLLAIMLSVMLVLVHPFNIVILIVAFMMFKVVEFLLTKGDRVKFNITLSMIGLMMVAWLAWSIYVSPMGTSIVDNIINVLSMESSRTDDFAEYSMGSGATSYWWMQRLKQVSMAVLIGMAALFFLHDIWRAIIERPPGPFLRSVMRGFDERSMVVFMMGVAVLGVAVGSLMFIADGVGIVGRSLNVGMMFIAMYVGAVTIRSMEEQALPRALRRAQIKERRRRAKEGWASPAVLEERGSVESSAQQLRFMRRKTTNSAKVFIPVVLAIVLLSVIFPMHAYSRDPYISYSESFSSGRGFGDEHLDKEATQTTVNNISLNDVRIAQIGTARDALNHENMITRAMWSRPVLVADNATGETKYESYGTQRVYSSGYFDMYIGDNIDAGGTSNR